MGGAKDIAFAQTEVSGAYTLTATSATMTALAPIGERRTAFTGALLDVLDRGAPGGERLLTLSTICDQLRRTLTRSRGSRERIRPPRWRLLPTPLTGRQVKSGRRRPPLSCPRCTGRARQPSHRAR